MQSYTEKPQGNGKSYLADPFHYVIYKLMSCQLQEEFQDQQDQWLCIERKE